MKFFSLALAAISLSTSLVQAFRGPAQILDDLQLRDLVDELDARYPIIDHTSTIPPALSKRDRDLVDALTLRYLTALTEDYPPSIRHLDPNHGNYRGSAALGAPASEGKEEGKKTLISVPVTLQTLNEEMDREIKTYSIPVSSGATVATLKANLLSQSGYNPTKDTLYSESKNYEIMEDTKPVSIYRGANGELKVTNYPPIQGVEPIK